MLKWTYEIQIGAFSKQFNNAFKCQTLEAKLTKLDVFGNQPTSLFTKKPKKSHPQVCETKIGKSEKTMKREVQLNLCLKWKGGLPWVGAAESKSSNGSVRKFRK